VRDETLAGQNVYALFNSCLTLILHVSKPYQNSRFRAEKNPILPHPTPCTALWGEGWGGGVGGFGYFLGCPEDLLNKTVNYIYIIIKISLKVTFFL
jgi:hypothetical protein